MFFAILIYFAIGAIAGWLATNMLGIKGYGLAGNIVVGIIGSIVGGFALSLIGMIIPGGLLGTIFTATIGAVLLLYALKLIDQK